MHACVCVCVYRPVPCWLTWCWGLLYASTTRDWFSSHLYVKQIRAEDQMRNPFKPAKARPTFPPHICPRLTCPVETFVPYATYWREADNCCSPEKELPSTLFHVVHSLYNLPFNSPRARVAGQPLYKVFRLDLVQVVGEVTGEGSIGVPFEVLDVLSFFNLVCMPHGAAKEHGLQVK